MTVLTGALKLDPLAKDKFTRAVLVQEPESEVRLVIFDSKAREQFNSFKKDQTIEVEGHWEQDHYKGGQQFVVDHLPGNNDNSVQESDVGGRAPGASFEVAMVALNDRLKVDGVWPVLVGDAVARYLDIYVSMQGAEFWNGLLERVHSETNDFAHRVCYGILVPDVEGVRVQKPSNYMFSLHRFSSYREQDWVDELAKQVASDKRMVATRQKLASHGPVPGVGRTPITRQALKRLRMEAEDRGFALDAPVPKGINLGQSFERIVANYGGQAVSRIFDLQEKALASIPNWSTPYFFERLLHKQYNPEQLIALKQKEIPVAATSGIPEHF